MNNVQALIDDEQGARNRMDRSHVDSQDFIDPELPKGTFSNSAYNSYKICGYAYQLKYIDKQPWIGTTQMVRGSSVHKGVEQLLRDKIAGKKTPLAEGLATVAKDYDERSLTVKDWLDEKPGELKDRVLKLYEIYHTTVVDNLNPKAVELPFAVKVEGIPMTGFIDLITEDAAITVGGVAIDDAPKKHVIRDLKTSGKSWSEDQVNKSTQLTLYSHITGVPDVAIDLLLATKKPVFKSTPAKRVKRDAQVLMEDMHEVVDQIKKGNFPKTSIDNWACGERCPYWTQCRGRKY